jgi:hypothetical protein
MTKILSYFTSLLLFLGAGKPLHIFREHIPRFSSSLEHPVLQPGGLNYRITDGYYLTNYGLVYSHIRFPQLQTWSGEITDEQLEIYDKINNIILFVIKHYTAPFEGTDHRELQLDYKITLATDKLLSFSFYGNSDTNLLFEFGLTFDVQTGDRLKISSFMSYEELLSAVLVKSYTDECRYLPEEWEEWKHNTNLHSMIEDRLLSYYFYYVNYRDSATFFALPDDEEYYASYWDEEESDEYIYGNLFYITQDRIVLVTDVWHDSIGLSFARTPTAWD